MKNYWSIIIITIFFFACGNNTIKQTAEAVVEESTLVTVEEEVMTDQKEEIIEEVHEIEKEVEEEVEEEKMEMKAHQKEEEIEVEKVVEVKEMKKEATEEVVEKVEAVRPQHTNWNEITKKNITSAGKVNYKGMKADLAKITAYLDHLKTTPPQSDWSKNEKLAYWINLYNASTVHLIASNYPISSITKINGGKPWDKKFVKSGDKTYTLNEIENSIVRPKFKDPRIHAALNCAAVSCPKILNAAFLPAQLNKQLNKQTKAWVNNTNQNKLTATKLQVSQIFDWYKVDFEASGGVIAFINRYKTTKMMIDPKAPITYLEYDWALNE